MQPNSQMPKLKGPRTGVRTTFMFLLWFVIAGVAVQVTLIGLGLFYDPTYAAAHIGFGWMFGHVGALLLIVGFFGRLGRNLTIVNAITFVLFASLPFLAGSRAESPLIAGLHPLVALASFALLFYMAGKVRALVPTPWGSAPRPQQAAAPTPASMAPMQNR